MRSLNLIPFLIVAILGCRPSTQDPGLQPPGRAGPRISLEVPHNGKQVNEDAVKAVKLKLTEQLNEVGLSRIAAALEETVEPSVRIRTETAEDQQLDVGVSKIGGVPDLPEAAEWPRWKGAPLAFIAQFKMVDVARHDLTGVLPQSGLLSFFYDARQETWGFDPNDRGSWQVLFFEDDQANLRRSQPPDDLPEEGRFKPCKLTFSTELTLPP